MNWQEIQDRKMWKKTIWMSEYHIYTFLERGRGGSRDWS